MTLKVLDSTGTQVTMSTTLDAGGIDQVGSSAITDPSTGLKQTVSAAHLSDGAALTGNSSTTAAVQELFNGSTYDRRRGNVDTGVLIGLSSAGASTNNSTDQTNYNHRGVQVGCNFTTITGSPSITVSIQGKDAASGVYYNLLTSGTITVTGFTLLTLYPSTLAAPGAPSNTNVAAPQVLPRTWRVQVVISGGASPSVACTIGASLIV